MRKPALGRRYDSAVTQWPQDLRVRITTGGVELVLGFRAPKPSEIAALEVGTAHFAWIDGEHSALLAVRFSDAISWQAAPFTPHQAVVAGDEPGLVGTGPYEHVAVTAVLVDADTGVVAGVRETSWPPKFVATVRAAIDRLAGQPFDKAVFNGEISALSRRYRSVSELVRVHGVCLCKGGL